MKKHTDWITAIAFSPDGKTIVTAGRDKTARLWDAVTGKPQGQPMKHQYLVSAAAFVEGQLFKGAEEDGERIAKASGIFRTFDKPPSS